MVNLEQMEQLFNDEAQQHMKEARENCKDLNQEYEKQQNLYGKYAVAYETAMVKEQFNGPRFAADEVNLICSDRKDIKILDYGCGSGLASDILIDEYRFKNIDGLDPCKELLDQAREKAKMQNIYGMGSNDSHACFPDKTYDLIFSSGVFFVSPSHAGFEVFPELIRMAKKGGYLVIVTGDYYLQFDHVNFKIVEDLEKQGKLKIFPKKLLNNYRKPIDETEGKNSILGAILTYQVL